MFCIDNDRKPFLQTSYLEMLELNILVDPIHKVVSIAPKYSVSGVLGYIKGKLAIRLFVKYESIGKRYWRRYLWSRGYCVSTIGLNEYEIRKYVRWQEKKDRDAQREGILEIEI